MKMTIEFIIDYFRITVHLPLEQCIGIYNEFFQFTLGNLSDLEHGAKGFKGVMGALLGFQLKHTPGNGRDYCTFEFPGQVCGCIQPEQLMDFYNFPKLREHKTNVTRLDLAFDNVPFEPLNVYQAMQDDVNRARDEKPVIRSLTERQSVTWMSDPYQMREDQSGIGCDTCYFGKRSSMRFLRVYNKHGPTRLELELKEERANKAAESLFFAQVNDWGKIAIGYLLDFIDIDRPWWEEFIGDTDRAYKKIHVAKEVSLDKSKAWLIKQVSPTFSALMVCTGGQLYFDMDKEGRKRMRKRYGPLISAYKSKGEKHDG